MPRVFLATFCGYSNANQQLSESLLRSREVFKSFGRKAGFQVILWDEELVRKNIKGGDQLVRDYSSEFLAACQEEQIRVNPEWLKTGLFRWKPAIICHTIQHSLDDGDVLVYLDCNLEKFPRYLEFIAAGPSYFLRLLGKRSVLLFQDRFRYLSLDTKGIVLESYLSNFPRHGASLPGLWAGCVVFRKSEGGFSIARSWLELCTIDNLAPLPDLPLSQRLQRYKWHSMDQSMLAILYYRLRQDCKSNEIRLIGVPSRRPMRWKSISSIYQFLRLKMLSGLSLLWQEYR